MSAYLSARSFAVLPFLVAAALVVAMFSVTPPAEAATRGQKVRQAVQIVRNQVGDQYQYGAAGPHRFDCSGLFYYSFRKAGMTSIPRTSDQQARFADRILKRNMRRGDLMFFYDDGGVYHVAMFVRWQDGRRRMIHSPYGGRRVHRSSPWTSQWFAGTLR